ncbi:MAG: hypothetical protein ABW184_16135 [Sphingobium sp.]
MPALLSIALAAAVVPATAVEANQWFTSKENPDTALKVAQRGAITYTIDVAPDGSAIRCGTQGTGGLDRKVCELVMRHARFLPAKDADGKPAFATYEGVASFLLPGRNSRPDRSKLVIPVDTLPDGVTSPAFARVAFLVDAAGAISHCASTAGERRRFQQTVEALGPVACHNLAKSYRPVPARDAAGNAVASVQSALVRFETPKAP